MEAGSLDTTTPETAQMGASFQRMLDRVEKQLVGLSNASTSITHVSAALARAQGAFEAVHKNCHNKFLDTRYADLGSMFDAVRPALAANELAVSQSCLCTTAADLSRGAVKVRTLLLHSSGEWLADVCELPVLPMARRKGEGGEEQTAKTVAPQAFGSAMTYAKRFSLGSLLGIAPDSEDEGGESDGVKVAGRRLVADAQRQQADKVKREADAAQRAKNLGETLRKLTDDELREQLERGHKKVSSPADKGDPGHAKAKAYLAQLEAEQAGRLSQVPSPSPS